jgi:hypothetical protein
MKYEGKKRKKEKCLKENTINEHIIFIKGLHKKQGIATVRPWPGPKI